MPRLHFNDNEVPAVLPVAAVPVEPAEPAPAGVAYADASPAGAVIPFKIARFEPIGVEEGARPGELILRIGDGAAQRRCIVGFRKPRRR